MFNPPNPIDVSGGYADVSALLQLLIDPAATKARLDELVAQQKQTEARIAELNEMQAETIRLHNTAKATVIVANNKMKASDEREAELDQKAEQLETTAARYSEAELHRRENASLAKEEALKREAERLATMRADLESRLAKVKSALDAAS